MSGTHFSSIRLVTQRCFSVLAVSKKLIEPCARPLDVSASVIVWMRPKSAENAAAERSSSLQNAGWSKSVAPRLMDHELCPRCGPYCMKILPSSFGEAVLFTRKKSSQVRIASSKDDIEK